jgi:hypothetical protein
MNIFKLKALPPDVLKRYEDHQNPSISLNPQDCKPFIGTITSPNMKYYQDPTIIGKCIILLNSAVLEGQCDTKAFFHEIPTCPHNNTPTALHTWHTSFTQWALSKWIYVIPFELIQKGHGITQCILIWHWFTIFQIHQIVSLATKYYKGFI